MKTQNCVFNMQHTLEAQKLQQIVKSNVPLCFMLLFLFHRLFSTIFHQGYCEDAQATNNSFCGDFYLTGDRGVQDEVHDSFKQFKQLFCIFQDGYFWFFSRFDDLIISSGYRIGPFEVESALIEHDAVLESAVVSRLNF